MCTWHWEAQTQLLMAFEGVVLVGVKDETEVSHKHWDWLSCWVNFQHWKRLSKDLLSSNRKPSWAFPVGSKSEYKAVPDETRLYLLESVWDLLLGHCPFWSANSTEILPGKSLRRVMPTRLKFMFCHWFDVWQMTLLCFVFHFAKLDNRSSSPP